jgi:phage shock protein PspC (stress-responsive transcriptional regulator)
MSSTNFDVQKALADIALIRRTLDQSELDQLDSRLVGVTLEANLVLQAVAFASALLLILLEILSDNVITHTLMIGGQIDEFRRFGIGMIAFILVGLLVALYFVLWRAALHSGETVSAYITRNFRYVKNLSLTSDLLMKFITLALLLLANRPEWVAPVLLAFTGDYLLQGRFFTFPTRTSVMLGLAGVAGGLAQFLSHSPSLLIPLAAFALVAGLSTARLALRQQQQKTLAA